MLQIHRELEEAAAMCGASPLTRLRRIVAPLLAPALLAGWLFIFLMAARVLSLRDPALGAALADHGGGDVRSLGQRPGHRACGARVDMVAC